MNIDRASLDKIAHLARLEFDEQDAQKMMDDMTAIVSWVEQLNEVPTDGVEPLTTMSHEVNALREDHVQPALDRAEALRQAPQHDGQHFRVPKVLE
ncbi:MAG: Asp-tRNA(Asn)/Glu-tRNA(Gln) amidotransferase subunit GatC [Cyclobacteriaceae bacterium]|jgi:aspartyl-tRNA(Asn)/glutamyl-tRNA(Gln) amidotransferase subunit C|nr:Asp-tRNA(Asn)/Glu-tRNA(Gln) amidotransferase GatCAB subunit C [Cytophagales bacterium]HNP76950.1 Asp-tRNA(Asn)/Glu-tRNA(Gln) amidotransferase subunit GatC [Cyclobacteriaceae bacterium]